MADFQNILNSIYQKTKSVTNKGRIATYIPELACIDINNFGMHLYTTDNQHYSVGMSQTLFSIQSVSKVLSLALAFSKFGNTIFKRVDVEPSGNPFNFLSLLEQENGIPRNPLINSGAIVIADMLVSHYDNPKQEFLTYVRDLTNDNSINFDASVAQSEQKTGYKNYAIANLLKSFGNLNNEVGEVLDFYFHQCSISMSCQQLSRAFYLFANRGHCLQQKMRLSLSKVKRINAIMLSCGFYDEAGEFAFEVGLPGKSGVGGGIVAVLPNEFVITTWSPGLNKKGNSLLGMKALEYFTTKTNLSIF